jgi:hypothetical protein
MKVTGGCHCGHITYEAEVNPATVRVCHCTDCQRLTGTAFRPNISSLPECPSGRFASLLSLLAGGLERLESSVILSLAPIREVPHVDD